MKCLIKGKINSLIKSKEAKNFSWLVGGRIAQMCISFLVSILTARYLGPNNYGTINYVAAYVAFFTSFCTLGINYVIVKDFVDYPSERGETIGTTLLLRGVASVLSLIMTVSVISIVDSGEEETIIVGLLCSISLLFQVFDTFNYWFQFQYKSNIISIVTLVAYSITAIYRVVLLIFEKNIMWFAFAGAVDSLCLAILLIITYSKTKGPKLSFSIKKAKKLLSRSYHYILSTLMIAIYTQTDKLMLKQILDKTEVGYYSLSVTLNSIWFFVLQAVVDSMYPTILKVYKNDRKEFNKRNRQLYALIIYISIFVSIIFVIFGKIIIQILYGEAYLPSLDSLRIITWCTMFSYIGVARNAWIVCENKQKYLKYMYLSAAIINIVLNYFFIPELGTIGASLASLITQIGTSIVFPLFIPSLRKNVWLIFDAFLLRIDKE